MKKNIIIIGIVLFFLGINITSAKGHGGRDNGNKINFTTVANITLIKYCPTGEELVDSQKNIAGFPRSSSLTCIVKDINDPSININWNGYVENKWTNKDVTINVAISDVGLGLKTVYYIINNEKTTPSDINNFEIKFNKEGTYDLKIYAEDKSTVDSYNGSPTTVGNFTELNYIIKIDKSPIAFIKSPTKIDSWEKNKPKISFNLDDTYEGIVAKDFICTGLPENAKWIQPASFDGKITGFCNPKNKDCTLDNNFEKNLDSCKWTCNVGFIKGIDNLCHSEKKDISCSINPLPDIKYSYDKYDSLTGSKTEDSIAYRTNPIGINQITGSFITSYNYSSNSYSPEINSCTFSCKEGYHNENGKCVDNSAIICCQKDYPLATSKTIGAVVDCTKPENAGNVACVYNQTCGGYLKDVFKSWENEKWLFESEGVTGISTLTEACGMENLPNSNGFTCNPKYYLVNEGLPTQSCELVPVGQWSGQDNKKYDCTNKPNNSYYTSNGDNNNCSWSCDSKFSKSGGSCKGEIKYNQSCTGLPSNAEWNNVDNIDQTWNGTSRTPSLNSVYNIHSSTNECRYECKYNYSWDGNSCEPDKKYNQSCTGLPSNAQWNNVDNIDQTWNGTSRTPSTTGVYNTNGSNTQCRYECKPGKTWDNINKKCN